MKIIVIGSPGAGKSTFARRLRDKINIPLFHLYLIYLKEDKSTISKEEFDKCLQEIFKLDKYIIDGNYPRTLEKRIIESNIIYFLDIDKEECLKNINNRLNIKREDMPYVDSEIDNAFFKKVNNFPIEQRPKIYDLLNKYQNNKRIYIFKTRNEIDEYIKKEFDK